MLFTLKALLVAVLVPPLGFATLALIALAVLRWRYRLGMVLLQVSVIGLMLLAVPAVSDTMLVALERDLPLQPPAAHPPKAIVVLGAEIARTTDSTGGVQAGRLTLQRLRAAAELYRRTKLPILVAGGSVHPHLAPVAMVMAETLQRDFGIPVQWVEDRSRDTWENAAFSAAILQREGIDSVYVVTHAWHMRRALISFRPTGLTITAAPTSLEITGEIAASDFVPRVSVWESAYFALHEWIGCAWYAFR